MQGRPSSSARPSTSARPTTAFDRDQFQYHQQRLQHQPSIEEEYEESDDEDVFAFLPPTTADQEQSLSQSPFAFVNHVQYPEPAFDPWGRQYPIPPSIPADSSEIPSSTDPNTYTSPDAVAVPPGIHNFTSPPYNQPSLPPPSPSTDSHPSTGMSGPDLYRLKRLGTATSSKLVVVDDVNEVEKERNGNNISEEADSDTPNHSPKDEEGCDNHTVLSERDGNIPSSQIASSQDFQHATDSHQADPERDAGLHRQSLAIASRGIAEGPIYVLRERGTKNPNAQPYKMYNQQASSYFGRDVRTGSGVGTVHSCFFLFLPSKPRSQLLKIPDSQAVNPRLTSVMPDLRILSPTFNHNIKHIIRTSNIVREWKLLIP